MATNVAFLNVPRVDIGLNTTTYTVASGAGGIYNVDVKFTELPPSGLSVVVNQNGTPVYTAAALSPTQIAQQFRYAQLYSAGDVITVVFSSSNANDILLNSVKSNVSIGQGA
jgi:hypothetical protein